MMDHDPTSAAPVDPAWVRHNAVTLAVHELAVGGAGHPLLLLHGLGESSPREVPSWAEAWPGPIHALDFTGHGRSTVPKGGGYTAEVLMGDVDAVLARLGPSTIVGRGLGAYVALLIAGGRPSLVRGAVLADGPGLSGGGVGPMPSILGVQPAGVSPPDPFALLELSRDVRPRDYAAAFARSAIASSPVDPAIAVATHWNPPWLEAVADEHGVVSCSLTEAVARYAR